jgi:uncharacterized protein (DUF58 family)
MRPERPLAAVDEATLARLARVADRLAWNRDLVDAGGRDQRNRPGRALEFLDYRSYVAGDDPRQIDWRASARQRAPVVRRSRSESGAHWWVCLDRSASMGLDPVKWELAVQLAAAFTFLLLHRDFHTGVLLFSGTLDGGLPPGRGRGQFSRCLALLDTQRARARGGSSSAAACLARLPRRSSLLVISDFLVADGMHGDLARLQALGGELHALQVLADDECPLPAPESALHDVESGEILALAEPAAARAAAHAALARQAAALAAFCRQRGIVHSRCAPALGWRGAASAHLAACRTSSRAAAPHGGAPTGHSGHADA